ncbi:MAG TPA: hypothetical protein VH950_19665 [Gaiellaceae bacterium]
MSTPEPLVERYLRLGLRLGRHVDGLVDAYYGPPELAAGVEAEAPVEPARLAAEATSLDADLAAGDLAGERREWLRDQARGLETYARILAGDVVSYADEIEGCYGIRPGRADEGSLAAAQARLDDLLPGDGPLAARYTAWRNGQVVPSDRVERLLGEVVAALRAWTGELVELPDGESVEIESVTNEPWTAFNYYRGGLASRIAVNRDLPISAMLLLELAAHETYPGHHTEHACKEQRLVRSLGRLEESILLVPTPQSLVSEGIAEVGADLALDGPARGSLESILREVLPAFELDHALAVVRAHDQLAGASVNAALMLHADGCTEAAAVDYLMDWLLHDCERAVKSVSFLTDPTWRAYAITYVEGARLCSAFVDGDTRAFARLLTEPVRVHDLLAAA